MRQEIKRVGPGRPPIDPMERSQIAADELIFPAMMKYMAMNGDGKLIPTPIAISEADIRKVYGLIGLEAWLCWFEKDSIDKTAWIIPYHRVKFVKFFSMEIGGKEIDYKSFKFPTKEWTTRLELVKAKAKMKLLKNSTKNAY